jgi:hypothetical protein
MISALLLVCGVKRPKADPDRQVGIALAIVDAADRRPAYLTETVEQDDSELYSATSESLFTIPTPILDQIAESPDKQSLSMIDSQAATGRAKAIATETMLDVGQMLDSTGGNARDGRLEMSKEDLLALAQEQALVSARKPRGEPVSLSVFGSERFSGRKFVFLLDQSDSMGSGGLGVLEASKSELDREIAKLLDFHEFQIVAYNDRTSMIARRRLLPATAKNKLLISAFLDGLVAVGGTEHRGGLMVALGLEPDVIVLISDGGDPALTERDLSLVTNLAKGKTQIHCLQFGAGANPEVANDFMRKLAAQTAGSFRYIDVSQWEQNKN